MRADGARLIGAVQVQIDRLLCDAAPGQVLAGRSSGETLRSDFGADAVAVATGGFSGKQYYAPTGSVAAAPARSGASGSGRSNRPPPCRAVRQ